MLADRLRVYIGPRRKRKNGAYYPRWPYRYKLPGQKWVHGTGTFTEATTRQFVDRLIQDELMKLAMGDRGVREVPKEEPLALHISEYLAWGLHEGGRGGLPWSKDHYLHRKSQLGEWVSALKAASLGDITYDAFSTINTAKIARGLSLNTVNHHAWALVAFMKWCRLRKRTAVNCLEQFTSMDRRPRRERGAFSAEEFQALVAVAPPQRKLIYRMAVFTGLRRSSLASLKVGDVDWAGGFVTLQWGNSKNRKVARKPLPSLLLEDLRRASAGKSVDVFLLDFSVRSAARDIHRDMKAAGIPIDKGVRRRDFHSLKASLGTLLDDMGAPPEITQKALDHASFKQTQAYIKREMEPLRMVIESLEESFSRGEAFHTYPDKVAENPVFSSSEEVEPSLSHSAPFSALSGFLVSLPLSSPFRPSLSSSRPPPLPSPVPVG